MLCMLQLTQPSFVAVSHSTAGSLLGSLRGVSNRYQTIVAKEAALPRDIKEVVNQMRASVQSALQARISRIDVDLPIGAEFGVEQGGETRKRGAKLTSADISKSDREVARLFVEMFEGTGLRPLVLFSEEKQAVRAKELWPGVDARIAVLGAPTPKAQQPRKAAKKRSGGGGGGFGAPAARSGGAPAPKQLTAVPPDTEVLFVVRPQGKEQSSATPTLAAVQSFCEESGLDKLVILLNARVDLLPPWWAEEFEQAYTFVTDPTGAAQEAAASGGGGGEPPAVVWRAYPEEWIVATKPKIGPPKQISSLAERPSQEAITAVLKEAGEEGGGLLGAIGLGNVF